MIRPVSHSLIAAAMILAMCELNALLLGDERGIEQRFATLADSSCVQCHDGSEPNGFDIGTLTGDLDDRATFALWEKIYDRVASGEMPPPGEPLPDSKQQKAALSAISQALTDHNRHQQAKFGRTVLRRLTRTELQHTLNDLLSIDIDLDEILPPENTATAFDTIAEKQGLSEIHVRAYLTAADAAIEQAIELRPKPETKTRTFVYKKQKSIRNHLEKKNVEQERVILHELDNAVVMFNTASYLFKLDDFYVDGTGRYLISATASSFQSDQPVTLTINVGHYEKGYTRLIGAYDLAAAKPTRSKKKKSSKSQDDRLGKPRTVSIETTLRRGSYVFPGAKTGCVCNPMGTRSGASALKSTAATASPCRAWRSKARCTMIGRRGPPRVYCRARNSNSSIKNSGIRLGKPTLGIRSRRPMTPRRSCKRSSSGLPPAPFAARCGPAKVNRFWTWEWQP